MKKIEKKIISMFLCLMMAIALLPTHAFAQSEGTQMSSETFAGDIEITPVTREEFIQLNADNWGISYNEAEQKIDAYEKNMPVTRGNIYREERVVMTQRKTLQSGYYLTCKTTAYALRDYLSGAYVEFVRATSANISLEGNILSEEWVGGSSSVSPWLASTSRLNVDYNGYIEFSADASISFNFGVITLSAGSSVNVYKYNCDGQFAYFVNNITSYK